MKQKNEFIEILRTCKHAMSGFIRNYKAVTYPIIKNPEAVFRVAANVKDPSWEHAYYAECYEHNKEQKLEVYSPRDEIFIVKNGIVIEGSDVLVTEYGAYWGKYNDEEFVTFCKPLDDNVVSYDRGKIKLDKFKRIEFVPGRVLPLIGHDAHHWVHNIYEFLPRLFSAGEAGLLNTSMKVLIIDDVDKTIMEIVKNYLTKFPTTQIVKANYGVAYKCEELYFQPVVGPSCSGYKFRLDYPWYIPHYIIEQVYRYVVNPVIERVKNMPPRYDKIFLGRSPQYAKNTRTLINYEEVHDYFISNGYVDIEGSVLTLDEKANIFYHAKEIVALFGSTTMNFIFCNQAKCIVLGNYLFATEPVIYPFFRERFSRYIYVTGQDESSEFHSSYYIPLDKIKKVYEEQITE